MTLSAFYPDITPGPVLLAYWWLPNGNIERRYLSIGSGSWSPVGVLAEVASTLLLSSPTTITGLADEALALITTGGDASSIKGPPGYPQALMLKRGSYGLMVEGTTLRAEVVASSTVAATTTISPGLHSIELRYDGSTLDLLVDGAWRDTQDLSGAVATSTEELIVSYNTAMAQDVRLSTVANTVADPSFEVTGAPLGDWSVGGDATATTTRVTTESKLGLASLEIDVTASTEAAKELLQTHSGIASPGETWTASVWAKMTATSGEQAASLLLRPLDAGLNLLETFRATTATVSGSFLLLSVTTVMPASTDGIQIGASLFGNGAGTALFDGFQLVKSPTPTPYADQLRWFGVLEGDGAGGYTSQDLASGETATIEELYPSNTPAGVIVQLSPMAPAAGVAVASAVAADPTAAIATGAPPAPAGLYTESTDLTFPGGGIIQDAAGAVVPLAFIAAILGFVLIPGAGFGVFLVSRSLLACGAVMVVATFLLVATSPIPLWVAMLTAIYCTAIFLVQRQTAV